MVTEAIKGAAWPEWFLRLSVESRPHTARIPKRQHKLILAFPAGFLAGPRRAVLVMAQWNSDEGGHVGVCRLMAALGAPGSGSVPGLAGEPLRGPFAGRRDGREVLMAT